ncbi:MAG: hypothetical protein RL273_1083 [Bacteroidota bacterium]
MLTDLSKTNSILNKYMAEIRDEKIQEDPLRFRKNMERIAEFIGFEISKKLGYKKIEVKTPLGISIENIPQEQPILCTILRAGLAMHNGLLNVFDHSESAFVSAYRKHTTPEEFEIYVEYIAIPEMKGKIWIISDPMLATGNSMVAVYKALAKISKPSKIFIASAIATNEAILFIKKHFPKNTEIFVAAIDLELTAQSYIVPGLGDAGDLAYGVKI